MNEQTPYLAGGTLIIIFGFFVTLGAIVAQIPICGPGGNCTEVDYVGLASGVGFGLLITTAGGWILRTGWEMNK